MIFDCILSSVAFDFYATGLCRDVGFVGVWWAGHEFMDDTGVSAFLDASIPDSLMSHAALSAFSFYFFQDILDRHRTLVQCFFFIIAYYIPSLYMRFPLFIHII